MKKEKAIFNCSTISFLFLLFTGMNAFALPEDSCPQTINDYQKLKKELNEEREKAQCNSVARSKCSAVKNSNSNSCKEIYNEIHKAMDAYEAKRKTGCVDLQRLVNNAKSCNLKSSASQVQCMLLAAESFQLASSLEKQISGGLDESLKKIEELKKASEEAMKNYQNDFNKGSRAETALQSSRHNTDDPATSRSMLDLYNNGTVVKNGQFAYGNTGEVVAAKCGEKTIKDYLKKLKGENGMIAEHSTSILFAERFAAESEELKKKIQQRITGFDTAAKDARVAAEKNGATAQETPTGQDPGGSGISMPSLPSMPAPSGEQKAGISKKSDSPEKVATAAKTKGTNVDLSEKRKKSGAKEDIAILPQSKEKKGPEQTISTRFRGDLIYAKGDSEDSGSAESNLSGKKPGNFDTKGSALLGVLKRNGELKSQGEGDVSSPSKQNESEVGASMEEAAGPAEEPAEGQPEEEVAAAEEEGSVEEGDSEFRSLSSEDEPENSPQAANADGLDLSTSLFDRVNRKLYQAYKSGVVVNLR